MVVKPAIESECLVEASAPPYYDHAGITLYNADCRAALRALPDESVHTIITSPPYWGLRDYGVEGQIGAEPQLEHFVSEMVDVFEEARRVLRKDGTLWLNLGDCHNTQAGKVWRKPGGGGQGEKWKTRSAMTAPNRMPQKGLKPKDLCGVPWRVALALQASGWWLRCDIIWHKPNPMPESVTDRPTRAHEYVFLMSKAEHYAYDATAIAEPVEFPLSATPADAERAFNRKRETVPGGRRQGDAQVDQREFKTRNKRSVWSVPPQPFEGAHFATFPPKLVEPMVLAGCPVGGVVLDPFAGAGTTLAVAKRLGRKAIGIELNAEYCAMAIDRLRQDVLPLGGAS